MSQVRFDASKEDSALISQIANRAVHMGLANRMNLLNVEMDLTACHCSGTPLRLAELLNATDFDFTHDICGISRYLNRITGELHSHFLPRYAQPEVEGRAA